MVTKGLLFALAFFALVSVALSGILAGGPGPYPPPYPVGLHADGPWYPYKAPGKSSFGFYKKDGNYNYIFIHFVA